MKRFLLSLLLAAFVLPQLSYGQTGTEKKPTKLQLVDGDSITGTVSGVRDGSVSVITDYGVIRVPLTRLTEASRNEVSPASPATVEQLSKRVVELETLVERLRSENSELRKQQAAAHIAPARVQPLVSGGNTAAPARVQAPTPTTKPAASGASFWISDSGKRHNSGCRYFQNCKGHGGTAGDGVACKICGG